MRAIIFAAALLATPVLAQGQGPAPAQGQPQAQGQPSGQGQGQGGKVWTAAPTPGNIDDNVEPIDRAGVSSSADAGAPFSAIPSGAFSGSGRTGSATIGTTPSDEVVTPNVSR